MNKYEQLIEHIINENEEAAQELFHQIVVEKSRDIYESLMDEEMGGNASQQFVQDISSQDDAAQEHGLGEDDEEAGEIELGGDDEFDHEEETFGDDGEECGAEEHVEIEDQLDNIEAELAELKALLGGSGKSGSGMGGDEFGSEEGESDFDSEEPAGFGEGEEVAEGKNPFAKSGSGASGSGKSGSGVSGSGKSGSGKSGSGVKESYRKSEVEIMKEYVDKIGEIYKQEPATGEGKTVGTGGDAPAVNTKGVVRGQGPKFDGESAANIATGGAEQNPDGKAIPQPKNEYSKGEGDLPGAGSFKNAPGNKKVWDKKESAGHGAEKKSGSEGKLVGNDGSRPVNDTAVIGKKVR